VKVTCLKYFPDKSEIRVEILQLVPSFSILTFVTFFPESRKPEAGDVFMDEDDDAMPPDGPVKDDPNGLVAMQEETLPNEKSVANEEEEVKPDEVTHEVAVGKGLACALKILQERGSLNVGTDWGGRTTDKKKSKLVGIEDGPKDIRIERLDEFGRVVTTQLYPFHCICTPLFPCIETMKFDIELHYCCTIFLLFLGLGAPHL
jgi:hypothetical protein